MRNDWPGKGAGTPERNQACPMKSYRTRGVSRRVVGTGRFGQTYANRVREFEYATSFCRLGVVVENMTRLVVLLKFDCLFVLRGWVDCDII